MKRKRAFCKLFVGALHVLCDDFGKSCIWEFVKLYAKRDE